MLFTDQYKTIASPVTGNYRDKGSRFLSFAIPVSTEAAAKAELEILRKKYHDATHHCYAYILGPDKSAWRMNDDGEPSGTAGRPIYGTLLSSDLTNILLVVVRYYGGTKLGVPGLINAYKSASADALSRAEVVTRTVKEVYRLHFKYQQMNDVMKLLKDMQAEIKHTRFDNECEIHCLIRKSEGETFREKTEKIAGLDASLSGIE